MKARGHPNDCACDLHKDDSPSVIGPPAPMPTAADLWKAKFCNHIVVVLTLDGQGWAVATAQKAAQCEYDALADYEGDPIESANECMSYWDCEPDFETTEHDAASAAPR
jgi:hypothetical protein